MIGHDAPARRAGVRRAMHLLCAVAALLLAAEGAAALAPLQSADPGRISGRVVDADDRPLATVAITLRSAADSSLVTGALTDASGGFRVEGLPVGRYLLHVGRIGYLSRSSEPLEITAAEPRVELGAIRLETAPVVLDGVEAQVDRPTVVVEADRTIYDARQMPVAEVGTTVDVLRAVPELEVDVNDNVRLRGNQAVAIHLNGRPTPMRGEQLATFLRQLPGDRVDRVEVMPNPSARHDPEGMGGIVNIVLREDVQIGLSGSISTHFSSRGRQALSGRFNVQRGRLTLFSGGSVNRSTMEFESWDLRRNLLMVPITSIEQTTTSENRGNGWNLDWTAELNVGEGATLWSNAWLFHSGSDVDGLTNYAIIADDDDVRERYRRENARTGSFGNYNFAGGFRKVFEPQRRELTIDGRYTGGGNESGNVGLQLFEPSGGVGPTPPPELRLNDIDANNGNLSIQTDYFTQFRGGRLDVGYRAWRRDQDNDNLLRIFAYPVESDPASETRSSFEYEEFFHSLYGTWAVTRGRFRAQGGLRAEHSTTTFDSRVEEDRFERSYTSLFPSGNVSFEVRPGRTLRLLYARRISRPPPSYLDPFVPPTDPLNRFFGNPDLEPSYTSSYTLDLTVNTDRGTVRVAPYYRRSTNVWERIRSVDEEGVATSRWENTATSTALGTNLTLSLRPVGRLSGSTSLGVYRDTRDGTNIRPGLTGSAWFWSLGGNLGVRVSDDLTAQVFANHFPSQGMLQGRSSGFTMTQVAFRQQLFERRGSVSLGVTDPLNLNRFDSEIVDPTFTQRSRSTQPSRMVTLSFSVNLGQTPQRQSRTTQGPEGGEGATIPGTGPAGGG